MPDDLFCLELVTPLAKTVPCPHHSSCMPRWIYNRPPEKCQPTELQFAQMLNVELGEEWVVRWGYWYEDGFGTLREGDFLVLGPTGGLAVFEVKSSFPQYIAGTRRWDTPDGDNPVTQLQTQNYGVIRLLNQASANRKAPWVQKALVFPLLEIAPGVFEHRGIPRDLIVAGNDLRDFGRVWRRLFPEQRPVRHEQRESFMAAFGEGIAPRSVEAFISETDMMLLRQATADYHLLDMLAGNSQLVFEGGVGTGKSWHAMEQARRLAENSGGLNGREVLVVAYNLALSQRLRVLAGRIKLQRGRITVESSETLATGILKACDIVLEPPSDRAQAQAYYDEQLPLETLKALQEGGDKLRGVVACYDALIVDEAQDHDTSLGSSEGGADGDCGWWSIYTALLKEGWNAPITIFGDMAQRPPFRDASRFSLAEVRARLVRHTHVRLARALRYTRPVFDFLRSLEAEGTRELVAGLKSTVELMDGPDVLQRQGGAEELPRMVEEVLEEWEASGLCAPTKVLILYERSTIERSVLADIKELCNHPLKPYVEVVDKPNHHSIGHSSVHKAKGLDSLAVILVGVRPFSALNNAQDRYTYFMGASRARQLLACVHQI